MYTVIMKEYDDTKRVTHDPLKESVLVLGRNFIFPVCVSVLVHPEYMQIL